LFGEELRSRRRAAGLGGSALAESLCWSSAKITKLESGERGTSEVDVAVYLTRCGVVGSELARLLALHRGGEKDVWVQPFGAEPGERVRTLMSEEARATAITSYDCLLIPGLLQSADYTRAVLRGEDAPLRTARQEVLRRPNRPDAVFFVDEQVLRRPVGGAAVMHDQLMALLFAPAVVRIVPIGPIPHGGVREGGFVLLDNVDDRPVVYLENKVSNVFLENPAHVAEYRTTVMELSDLALAETESKEFVTWLADEYGAFRGRSDDVAQEQLQRWQRRGELRGGGGVGGPGAGA
jgi:hypothetical protein